MDHLKKVRHDGKNNYCEAFEGTPQGEYFKEVDKAIDKNLSHLKVNLDTPAHVLIKPGETGFVPNPRDVLLSVLTIKRKKGSMIVDMDGKSANEGEMITDYNGQYPFQAIIMEVGVDFQHLYEVGDIVFITPLTINMLRDTLIIKETYMLKYSAGNITGKIDLNKYKK